MKIVVMNTNCSWNKGSAAQVISTCKALKNVFPSAAFSLISHFPDKDNGCSKYYEIKVVSNFWIKIQKNRYAGFLGYRVLYPIFNFIFSLLPKEILPYDVIKTLKQADLVVDLSGDSYSDSKGGFSLAISSSLLLTKSMKKKLVLYSQSIGPFSRIGRYFARKALNKADMIIVREKISYEYLKNLGIKTPLYLTSDCAFLLDSISPEKVKEILTDENICLTNKPLVGISVNAMIDSKHYIDLIKKTVEYLIDNNFQVIFVPHAVSVWEDGRDDDRIVATIIYDGLEDKSNVFLVEGDYSPMELKGIIGLCDLFIGSRMHANIAAISSLVPTIAVGWSHKYYGIMEKVGLEEYVFSVDDLGFEELKGKIEKMWDNREAIRNELKIKVETEKELALKSAKLVRNIF